MAQYELVYNGLGLRINSTFIYLLFQLLILLKYAVYFL